MNKFYVYAYLREDRYTPYYIGKGCGKRCYYKYGKNCKPPKDRSRIIIIKNNLLEEDAFNLEKVISFFAEPFFLIACKFISKTPVLKQKDKSTWNCLDKTFL